MSPRPSFGRRGVTNSKPASAFAGSSLPPTQPVLPPDLVAAILRSPEQESSAKRPPVKKVGWSLRAAVLAGLIVGFLNAAANATGIMNFGGKLEQTLLGDANVPFAVILAAAGLWSGARASALAFLFAHGLLSRLGRTSYIAYALAGGVASAAYALMAEALGFGASHHSFAIEVLSGMAAGFFYRLFAAADRS